MGDPKNSSNEALGAWLDKMSKSIGANSAEVCKTDEGVQHSLSEKDWTAKKSDFVGAIRDWCQDMRLSVNEFEKDVSKKKADTGEVTLAVSIAKAVLGEIVPKDYAVAKAIAEATITYVATNMKGVTNGKVTLRSFCSSWDSAFHDFQGNRGEHDKMFKAFRTVVTRKCGDEVSFEAISREIDYLAARLPGDSQVRKLLLRTWIDSSEDESAWLGDVIDDAAGYFHVRVHGGLGTWKLLKAYLDDTDEQNGVIAMLQSEYGKTTKLEKLPFPMKVFLTHGVRGDQLTIGEKRKSGALKFSEGNRECWDDWLAGSQAHPATKDLKKDTVL